MYTFNLLSKQEGPRRSGAEGSEKTNDAKSSQSVAGTCKDLFEKEKNKTKHIGEFIQYFFFCFFLTLKKIQVTFISFCIDLLSSSFK